MWNASEQSIEAWIQPEAIALADALEARLRPDLDQLAEHAIYGDAHLAIARFMEFHVYAVWDFMSLLTGMIARLRPGGARWRPTREPVALRLLQEILLAEETDVVTPTFLGSHYEFYLQCMAEVGADASTLESIVNAISWGQDSALLRAPEAASSFVRTTLALVDGPIEGAAGALVFGREVVLPEMFARFDGDLPSGFRRYLDRHVELDGGEHGPKAKWILARLCGTDPARWARAERGARASLAARRVLWDGALAAVRESATVGA